MGTFFTSQCTTFSGLKKRKFISVGNKAIGTKGYVAVEVYFHIFLISVLGDGDRFTPGKESRHPLNRRVGGHQSRPGHFGEDNLLLLPIIETRTLGRPGWYLLSYSGSIWL